jgi:hypothetical protein
MRVAILNHNLIIISIIWLNILFEICFEQIHLDIIPICLWDLPALLRLLPLFIYVYVWGYFVQFIYHIHGLIGWSVIEHLKHIGMVLCIKDIIRHLILPIIILILGLIQAIGAILWGDVGFVLTVLVHRPSHLLHPTRHQIIIIGGLGCVFGVEHLDPQLLTHISFNITYMPCEEALLEVEDDIIDLGYLSEGSFAHFINFNSIKLKFIER